jgi:hypothetical protein
MEVKFMSLGDAIGREGVPRFDTTASGVKRVADIIARGRAVRVIGRRGSVALERTIDTSTGLEPDPVTDLLLEGFVENPDDIKAQSP